MLGHNMFRHSDIIAVDTETTGLNPWTGDRAFGVSMADANDRTAWFEFPVNAVTREVNYNTPDYATVKTILENKHIEKVFFNAQFDLRMLEFAGINVAGNIHESSLAVRICGVDRMYWKLKPLCKHFFDISDEDESTLKKYVQTLRARAKDLHYGLGAELAQDYWLIQHAANIMSCGLHLLKTYESASWTKKKTLDDEAKQTANEMHNAVGKYGTLDAVRTITTWIFFEEQLREKKLYDIYEEENELLLNTTYEMVSRGIQLDEEAVKRGMIKAKQLQATTRFKINKTFWYGFNPNSVNDKRRYFIDYKRLVPLNHSKKTSAPSIDETFLEYHAKTEPGARAIIDHVAARKAKATYFDYMASNHDTEWVIHPDLNQFGTLTGRYSGRFLTMPKRAKPGSIMLDVRRCLVPREGCYWLLADYSQIEARIYADEFEEETMIAAFTNGEDVYTALQNSILQNTKVDVGRQVAKNIFLGKIYGLGLEHLIEMIMEESHVDVDRDGAADIVVAFDETFPGVSESMKKVGKKVERTGFIKNRYGQIIYVPYDFSYKGVNYIIQSTAQRFIKRAMLRLADWLTTYNSLNVHFQINMLLQIHDELMFECTDVTAPKKLAACIKSIMEDTEGKFDKVRLTVEFELCTKNWLEKEKLVS
jgi:DNA polymerase I-like protein with 3'-5' exonuclease and polymerase domains